MARVLIVGCGCRGRELARELLAAGHAVRGTTRRHERLSEIAAAGAEPYLGDPDRVATLMEALEGVTVVCWLLAGAAGDPAAVADLHGPRLAFLLSKLVDTPVRGFAFEAAGEGERETVHEASDRWRIPVAEIDYDPWPEAGRRAIERLLDSPATE